MTADQMFGALAHANEVRRDRIAAKRAARDHGYHDAVLQVARLLEDPPEWLLSIPVIQLLKWVPGVGDRRAERWLSEVDVFSLLRELRQLTVRQRGDLARLLRADLDRMAAV